MEQLCHVSIFPILLHTICDLLDCAVGELVQTILNQPDKTVDLSNPNIPSLFRSLQQTFTEPINNSNPVFNQIITNCIIISNTESFLHLLETQEIVNSIQRPSFLHSQVMTSIQSLLIYYSDKDLGSDKIIKQQLSSHPFSPSPLKSYFLPIFAPFAQNLSSNMKVCEKLPIFADYFVFSLFERQSVFNTSEEYYLLFQTVAHTLSFLLTVTQSWSAFFDGGYCMAVNIGRMNNCIVFNLVYSK